MNSNVKIILTDQAAKQLQKYKDNQGNKLIEEIASRKFVPGDDEVEITASDIETGGNRMVKPKMPVTMIIIFYMILGSFLMILGFNYDIIKNIILKNDPVQIVLLAMGVIIFLMGIMLALSFFMKDYMYFFAGRMARKRMKISAE